MTTDVIASAARSAWPEAVPSPADVFRAVATEPGVVFLDGRAAFARAPWSHLTWKPLRRFRLASDGTAAIDGEPVASADPVAALDDFLSVESAAERTVFGVIGYDLGRWIEPAAGSRASGGELPLAALASYEHVLHYDHRRRRWSGPAPELRAEKSRRCRVSGLRVSLDEASYTRLFDRAQAWIAAGDIYQVNLSIAFEADIAGHPAALYEQLANRHPVPYGAYLDCGDFQVLSNSPELFLERRGRRLVTRPIKGTRPRGATPGDDRRLREELSGSAKERAEHVMIVDLERSDLGRLAEIGSVRVEELEAVESYPTLHHLESTIVAELRSRARFSDILRATFPGGSITGAPKIRAMQIIDELEGASRGFYTGGVLHHSPSGDFTLNIAIRTATVAAGRIRYAAGGGVVSDSTAAAEYRECLLKARAFVEALPTA